MEAREEFRPPPYRPRLDAFETAHEGHSRLGNNDQSSYRSHFHRTRNPTFTANGVSAPTYCQPITTVTATASVTVAVHPPIPSQNAFGGYPHYEEYSETKAGAFVDPHVPFDASYKRDSKVEVLELEDDECETQSNGNRTH